MKKLFSHVDIAQIEKNGEYFYHIEGWAFFKDHQAFSLEIWGDDRERIPCTLEKSPGRIYRPY